ncbi:unnamed protein product, partial [Brenthis ino]
MWNELQSSPSFYIHYVKQRRHHILITDYVNIWEIYLSEEEFLKCLTESNIGLEMGTQELIQKGIELLMHPQDLKKINISHDGTSLVVVMTKFYGFPFKLKLHLKEGSRELFFHEVMQPILKTIHDLKSSENELRTLLKKKDVEIEEYKSLGGKIRYTALPRYNDEEHMKKHSAYNTHFGVQEIPNNLLQRVVHVSKENDIDNIGTNIPIKSEPESQEVISNQTSINRLIQIKQERIKNELPTIKRRRPLNI